MNEDYRRMNETIQFTKNASEWIVVKFLYVEIARFLPKTNKKEVNVKIVK